MTAPVVTDEPQEQRTGLEAVGTSLKDRLQQFLAFASLIVIFLFFSLASSNFLNYSNVTAILFSTVVIGLLWQSSRTPGSIAG
jgi:ribose transport system permease protein